MKNSLLLLLGQSREMCRRCVGTLTEDAQVAAPISIAPIAIDQGPSQYNLYVPCQAIRAG